MALLVSWHNQLYSPRDFCPVAQVLSLPNAGLRGLICALVCMLLTWLLPVHAHAEGQIDIQPYAAATLSYDDNLFRFSNAAQARASLGSSAMSDQILRAEAGVDVDWKLSRQHLILQLNLNKTRFDRFSFLDNTGSAGKIGWNWQLGNDLSGEISTSETESMAGFTEIRNPILNLRTYTHRLFTANWDIQPSWRLHLLREDIQLENGLATYRTSNREDVVKEGGVQYSNAAGNQLGLSLRFTDSSYPNRDAFSTFVFGNGNSQREIAANMVWWPTVKTRISGRISDVKLEYDELPQRNFTGLNERINLDWYSTGKSSLNLTAWQELNGVDDLAATYVRSQGIGLNPTWVVSDKVVVKGQLSYERRAYLGDPGFILGSISKRDDVAKTAGFSVSYSPSRKVQMQLSYQGEQRRSSQSTLGYDDNTLGATLRVDF